MIHKCYKVLFFFFFQTAMQMCAIIYATILITLMFLSFSDLVYLSIPRLLTSETFGILSILLLIYAILVEDPFTTAVFILLQVC